MLVLPFILGIVASLTIIIFFPEFTISKNNGLEIVSSIIDVWGILLGFVITAVSILLTANKNELIENLIVTNHMQSILFSYIVSSVYLFVTISFALVLIILQIWNRNLAISFIGLNIVIITSVGMSISFLFRIIYNMNK